MLWGAAFSCVQTSAVMQLVCSGLHKVQRWDEWGGIGA